MKIKKYISDYARLFSIAAVIVIVDQLTKYIIRTNLAYGEIYKPDLWLSQYIRIVHWHNTGAAFGMFQDLSTVFTVLSFVVAIVIILYFPSVPKHEWTLRLAMSLQLGGALGNLIDRLTIGHVTDFVSVGNFPVFNVADASISIGAAVLFLGLWVSERKQRQTAEDSESEAEEGPIIQEMLSSGFPEEIQGE